MSDQNYKLIRPQMDDAEAVYQLAIACDIADHGEPDTELGEIVADWEDADLEQDAWLAYTSDDLLIGYALIYNGARNFTFNVNAAPALDTGSLTGDLLKLCEARGVEMIAVDDNIAEKSAVIYVAHSNQKGLEAIQAAGFAESKLVYIMQADISGEIKAPMWPQGAAIRTMSPSEDDRTVFEFIYENFDWPGRGPWPEFDSWQKFMMRPDHFIPEIWFLLEREGEIIAAALCYDYPETGWIRQFAAKKTLRRQGIGRNLLNHVFHIFEERGHDRVSLSVESDNPLARQFYLDCGMLIGKQFDQYDKMIGGSGELGG